MVQSPVGARIGSNIVDAESEHSPALEIQQERCERLGASDRSTLPSPEDSEDSVLRKETPHTAAPMTKNELLERISVNPAVCFGKPYIKGHRIWVSLILHLLAGGTSIQEILDEYPGLEEADILACIAYGAEMSRERYVDISIGGGSITAEA
jgi:uncharacterized protein (DUF433 family)